MSKILHIATAVPPYRHDQQQIAGFMNKVYGLEDRAAERIKLVYDRSRIETRYSIIPDFSLPSSEWKYFPGTVDMEPFPNLDERMKWYMQAAPELAANAAKQLLNETVRSENITHLVTVSCTGMSAPGIDIDLVKKLGLPTNCQRTSVNFMGCYAAIHGLKIADAICRSNAKALVMVVCVELCTIHFQKDATPDNVASSLLFSDGAAAVLVAPDTHEMPGNQIQNFYSEIAIEGEEDMSWNLSEKGFLMHLSSYIPRLIENHIERLLVQSLEESGICRGKIAAWAIHPGGKKILETSAKALSLTADDLKPSYDVLKQFGNMSSVTILFVLKEMLDQNLEPDQSIFAAAFGPGITIETMMLNTTPC